MHRRIIRHRPKAHRGRAAAGRKIAGLLRLIRTAKPVRTEPTALRLNPIDFGKDKHGRILARVNVKSQVGIRKDELI